jgi:D-sedoheptulose 7-phosphate isomerase
MFINLFLKEIKEVLDNIDEDSIKNVVDVIKDIKASGGRIFFAGSGGGAGHSSHAVCDFRKLLDIECYSITDNVSELTARINDDSFESSYTEILKVSKPNNNDCLFIFSVGGGSRENNISPQLCNLIDFASENNMKILGIVGRDGGYLAKKSKNIIIVPTVNTDHITPHTEGMQAYLWHLIVTDPALNPKTTMWESVVE